MSTWTVTIPDEFDDMIIPTLYEAIVPKKDWGPMYRAVFFDQHVRRGVRVTTFSAPESGIAFKRDDS